MSRNNKNKQITKHVGDITVNEFANSSIRNNRPKKSFNNVSLVVKEVLQNDKQWNEEIDQFEINLDVNAELCERVQDKLGRIDLKNNAVNFGNEYPLDIWFLISEFISPEDVGRFSGICKYSLQVVCAATFWINLYKRHYHSVPMLPTELKQECLVRKFGIRTTVIRALHFMYKPFIIRTKSIYAAGQHPDLLKQKKCISVWHRKRDQQWIYYFKFKENLTKKIPKKQDLSEVLGDISANPEEGCSILRVACSEYTLVPPIIGLKLTSVSLTLSQVCHHKLQMWFGPEVQTYFSSRDGGSSNDIILDPVSNVKVLHWWHPLYIFPRSFNVQQLLHQEET